MEYILSMTFLTTGGKKATISISGVKPDITQAQAVSLMDTIIAKNVFEADSGDFVSKESAKLTERKVTKYEIQANA